MSFPNRDAQILAHILEYCNRIEKTLSRFPANIFRIITFTANAKYYR